MQFVKLHGYGNDYIVVEAKQLDSVDEMSETVRRVCNRHYGAGADGIALVSEADKTMADFGVRIFNPDGSEAAMSGNGTRCAAAYLYYQGLWSDEELKLTTRAGVKKYRLTGQESDGRYRFAAEIGRPVFESTAIPMSLENDLPRVVDYPLIINGATLRVTALQMCNPNCCLLVDNFDELDWRKIGAAIERDARFPERTNVEFIRVRNARQIEVRVWERGVGETLSSGTGACASAVAAMVNNQTERRITVKMPGGLLEVEWRTSDDEVVLTGSAEVIYRGEWLGH